MGYISKRRAETKRRMAVWCFSAGIFFVSAVKIFLPNGNFSDHLSDYRILFIYLSVLAFTCSIIAINFRTAVISLLAFLINFTEIASHSDLFKDIPDPTEIWAEPIVKKIAVINVSGNRSSYIKIMSWLNENTPDYTIILNAIDKDFMRILKNKFNHTITNKTMAFFTDEEITEADTDETNNDILWVKFTSPNERRYVIVAVNLPETKNGREYNHYVKRTEEIAEFSNTFDDPVILVGGFNASPWTEKIKKLFSVSFKTNILYGNYPSYLPKITRKTTDYIYTHSGIDIIKQTNEKANGSLHLPILATVSIRPI